MKKLFVSLIAAAAILISPACASKSKTSHPIFQPQQYTQQTHNQKSLEPQLQISETFKSYKTPKQPQIHPLVEISTRTSFPSQTLFSHFYQAVKSRAPRVYSEETRGDSSSNLAYSKETEQKRKDAIMSALTGSLFNIVYNTPIGKEIREIEENIGENTSTQYKQEGLDVKLRLSPRVNPSELEVKAQAQANLLGHEITGEYKIAGNEAAITYKNPQLKNLLPEKSNHVFYIQRDSSKTIAGANINFPF